MEIPKNIELPFFAYGLFKPGQISFFKLRELVAAPIYKAKIKGQLLLRDGLAVVAEGAPAEVGGYVLSFVKSKEGEAYKRISDMEPDKQYRWGLVKVGDQDLNILYGRRPYDGSVIPDDGKYDSWKDPLFKEALEVAEEVLSNGKPFNDKDLKPFFRFQMAYLLLWSAIERYGSLRYQLGQKVHQKIIAIGKEQFFREALKEKLAPGKSDRHIVSAASPEDRYELNVENPEESLKYYYQVRCNIAHRGKAAFQDYHHVKFSLQELLPIFRHMLSSAEKEAASWRELVKPLGKSLSEREESYVR